MDLVHPQAEDYLITLYHQVRNDPTLDAMEKRAEKDHFPIIGPLVGKDCYLQARAIGAKSVFELGSGYGYSTYWFAKAVKENGGGIVHHSVWDEDLSKEARDFMEQAGLADLVEFHVSEAIEAFQKTDGPFDIVFVDINKHAYPDTIPFIKPRLRTGGLVIIDNILWRGKVWDPSEQDKDTVGIREVTRLLMEDPDFITTINPLRDGFILALKTGE